MGSILRASQQGNGECNTKLQQATSVPLGTGPRSHSNINVQFPRYTQQGLSWFTVN